ncbi:MAG TPA: lytic transglycosylase domain-containing protein [Dongiaceae bacterium]|nr:lytic transglycosylase domain-containing protein [Dongiaceae bacterium]
MNFRRLQVVLLGVLLCGGAWWGYDYWREHREDKVILAAAHRYGVDPALVKAVVWRESNFNSDAHGGKGELGLMQVSEHAAQEWADSEHIPTFVPEQLINPTTNVYAGAFYLGKLLRRYLNTDNPMAYALADYNAGRTPVLRWNRGAGATNSAVFLDQMDFPTTRRYVLAILKRRIRYLPDFVSPPRQQP